MSCSRYFIRFPLCSGTSATPCSSWPQAPGWPKPRPPPLYFPPTTGSTWATTTPASLGWCQPQLDSLIAFAGRKSSRSLLILKDGSLVVRHYLGTYPADSAWY